MAGIDLLVQSKEDVDSLALSDREIMDAVEMGLRAHGEKEVILPPKDHLALDYPEKLFSILKDYVGPIETCGVNVLGNFHGNYRHGVPSELSTLLLTRPDTGTPFALINSTAIT